MTKTEHRTAVAADRPGTTMPRVQPAAAESYWRRPPGSRSWR